MSHERQFESLMLLFCLLVAFICSLLLHLCEHNTLYGFRICRCMSRVVLVEQDQATVRTPAAPR